MLHGQMSSNGSNEMLIGADEDEPANLPTQPEAQNGILHTAKVFRLLV